MKPVKVAEITADLETRLLPEAVAELDALKDRVLGERHRLPSEYPELERGELSRTAILHGDLGILASAIEEAASQARTAISGHETRRRA